MQCFCVAEIFAGRRRQRKKCACTESCSSFFERPAWDISFHVNMDAAALIGSDTFRDGRVTFRPGPVYCCAQSGGFGILDEINMARNESTCSLTFCT